MHNFIQWPIFSTFMSEFVDVHQDVHQLGLQYYVKPKDVTQDSVSGEGQNETKIEKYSA